MPAPPILCYITDRTAFAENEDEPTRRRRLLEKIAEAARAGVNYIQLREKDLSAHELESLAHEAVRIIQEATPLTNDHGPPATALLINSRTDVALAINADGVHLRSDDITPEDVRAIWAKCGAGTPARELSPRRPILGASCHSPADVARAATNGASFAVFGPVFEKKTFEKKAAPNARAAGLAQLEQACKNNIPVLALGGITLSNALSCLEAGAAGIAAIRLFQENDILEVISQLRSMRSASRT